MCVKRYILGISLTHKAELKKILVEYPVKTSIKGGRHQPVKLSNKSGKHLISSSLGIGPLRQRSRSLGRIGPHPYRSCNLYTVRLKYTKCSKQWCGGSLRVQKKKPLQYCYRANRIKNSGYYDLNTLLIFISLTPFKIKSEVIFRGAKLYI